MADFSALKQSIETYIKNNGNKEITGAILQNILLSMVTTMGDRAINDNASDISHLNSDLSNEINRAKGKLNNEKFVSNAPDAVVQAERDKQAEYEKRHQAVQEQIAKLHELK